MTSIHHDPFDSHDEASFEASWWDATLDADHWFSMTAISPLQAALLLTGFNPHDGGLERLRADTSFNDLQKLHERFVDSASADGRACNLKAWLERAESQALKHSPWARRYLESKADTRGGQDGEATAEGAPVEKASRRKPSWWKVAGPYVLELVRANRYATGKRLYLALRKEASNEASPFTTRSEGVNQVLIVRQTGREVDLKTVQNKWPEIERAVGLSRR